MKVDFELQDPKFYFMSPTYTNLKVSFEQAILKIPKYQLEQSLYDSLMHKMIERPLKLCWTSNDVIIHTIGQGVTQARIFLLSNLCQSLFHLFFFY